MPTEAERSSVVEIIPKGLGRYVTPILRLMLYFPLFLSSLFLPFSHSVISLFTHYFLSLSLLPFSAHFFFPLLLLTSCFSPLYCSTKSSSQGVHIAYVTGRHTHQIIPIRVPQNCRELLSKSCFVLFCSVLFCSLLPSFFSLLFCSALLYPIIFCVFLLWFLFVSLIFSLVHSNIPSFLIHTIPSSYPPSLPPSLPPSMTVRLHQTLSRNGYYDNVIFHRVIKGFMIQVRHS